MQPAIVDMTAEDRHKIRETHDVGRKYSSFLLHLFAIADAIGIRSTIKHALLKNPDPWTDGQFKQITHGKLGRALTTMLHEDLQKTRASGHYHQDGPWKMLGDVEAMSPTDMRTGYLMVIHIRTNGHYLGSGASKKMRPRPAKELCPCCWKLLSDTPLHALLWCTAPRIEALRQKYLPVIVRCIQEQQQRGGTPNPEDPQSQVVGQAPDISTGTVDPERGPRTDKRC